MAEKSFVSRAKNPNRIAPRWTAYPHSARSLIRTVDLKLAPSERWIEILSKDKAAVKKLFRQAKKEIPSLVQLASLAMGPAYRLSGGLYSEEIKTLADWAGSASA